MKSPALLFFAVCAWAFPCAAAAPEPSPVYAVRFQDVGLGRLPEGWKDLVNYRPNRNWAVDGAGILRVMMKEYVGDATDGDRKIRRDYLAGFGMRFTSGVLVYDGLLANGAQPATLKDVSVTATLRKTPDDDVSVGVILRLKDVDNYYAARLRDSDQLEIVRMVEGKPERLAVYATRARITDSEAWTLVFSAKGDHLSARLHDAQGVQMSLVDAVDGTFPAGAVGVTATTFAGIADFEIRVPDPGKILHSGEQIAQSNSAAAEKHGESAYPVVAPAEDPGSLNTPFEQIADSYDVVVAGGGTGGFGAALQAARMGARVLLLEETDCIGGQMANAGVTSMDEGGFWGKNTARERGIYREFHESAVNYYYTILKDPFTAYHFNRQSEGGYEPRIARAILYGLIAETRRRTVNGRPVVLDLAVRTKVTAVEKDGNTVTGATLTEWTEAGPRTRKVRSTILIDATEYGDVIPLTGARYRVGNARSDRPDPAAPMQDHTWLAVMKEYPAGIPDELKMKNPPPAADYATRRFRNYTLAGEPSWGSHKEKGKDRIWWAYVAWRGMPDSTSAATGEMTEQRHTRCGFNGGNDYAVTAATCEDPAQRRIDELAGINKTLGIIWYYQHVLGLPWSVADDEGYATPFQFQQMRERGVPEEFLAIAARLPQLPYARESRRIIGVETIRGEDIYLRERGDMHCKHWASSVAINDYSIDLHGTEDSIETDLDEAAYINNTGPFEIPFGAFIPEQIDGFLPAEKNISQSRLVNGSTRLQPSTMTNGQAAGAMAALAVRDKVAPRHLNIIAVQSALLDAGDSLIPRWYSDVRWGTPLWRATQLLSLYGMMDRPGDLTQDQPLGHACAWEPKKPVDRKDVAATIAQLGKLVPDAAAVSGLQGAAGTREDFTLAAAAVLRAHGRSFVKDPPPYAPPYDLSAARKAHAEKAVKQGGSKKEKKKKSREKEAPAD